MLRTPHIEPIGIEYGPLCGKIAKGGKNQKTTKQQTKPQEKAHCKKFELPLIHKFDDLMAQRTLAS